MMMPHEAIEIDHQASAGYAFECPAISFTLGSGQTAWTHHAREIRTLRNEPDTQSNPTRNICQTRRGKRTMTCVGGIARVSLPACDRKDRADARIPSKCTVCRKRGEMETTRGKWEND